MLDLQRVKKFVKYPEPVHTPKNKGKQGKTKERKTL